jgi:hypothetical protein
MPDQGGQQRPDQGQQWDPNKQGGGKEPGRENYPGDQPQRGTPGQDAPQETPREGR